MITPESKKLAEQLAAVTRFALGGVGIVGQTSAGEQLTLELSRRPDAAEAFDWLADNAGPVARLYAHWALRTLAPDRAEALAVVLRADTSEIETMSGCILLRDRVGSIVERIGRTGDVYGRKLPRP
ncbi:MAG TPA: hypothetical protein VK607_02935 [Kofleriaceae bacterium]|nr:hypothetical protein [Kofleriaceae bacterium]HMG53607.1 hypothetical protein [Kofleriaceae bacterium]